MANSRSDGKIIEGAGWPASFAGASTNKVTLLPDGVLKFSPITTSVFV